VGLITTFRTGLLGSLRAFGLCLVGGRLWVAPALPSGALVRFFLCLLWPSLTALPLREIFGWTAVQMAPTVVMVRLAKGLHTICDGLTVQWSPHIFYPVYCVVF